MQLAKTSAMRACVIFSFGYTVLVVSCVRSNGGAPPGAGGNGGNTGNGGGNDMAAVGPSGSDLALPPGTDLADDSDIDLLHGHDWSHFSGGWWQPDGEHITSLGRVIVPQKGTGTGQANPPVNALGPHLNVSGDFRVSWTMENVDSAGAFFQLYGEVPIIYDEWRKERHSVRVGVVGGQLVVSIWDETADLPILDNKIGSGLSGTVKVDFTHQGSQLIIDANGTQAQIPDHAVFASGQVWFGADAAMGGQGWLLSRLVAHLLGAPIVVVDLPPLSAPHDDSNALRNLGASLQRPINLAGALAFPQLFADDPYRALAAAQLAMVTPENAMKPQFLHPQPTIYDFTEGDAIIAFAEANGIAVHGHTLVWFEALPPWMRKVTGAAAIKQMMLDHIDQVAGHFKGRVAEWDVVNEPMSDNDIDYTNGHLGLRPMLWFNAMGESYIDLALQHAHMIDPQAKLYINEYGCEDNGNRWDGLLALVKRLKARGVPLDGIGFQNHEYNPGDYVNPATFAAHVKALAQIGLSARVSEMDVLVNTVAERPKQASEFAGKLGVCRQEPNCTTFTFWGITDRYSSTSDIFHYPTALGDCLPFDEFLQPKPAYSAMQGQLH